MNLRRLTYLALLVQVSGTIIAQNQTPNPYNPDSGAPKVLPDMTLVWNDEFRVNGKPDSSFWRYEKGFVRNQELQWYQSDNANYINGLLVIEARREQIINPNYVAGSTRWNQAREYAEYSAASIQTRGKKQWLFLLMSPAGALPGQNGILRSDPFLILRPKILTG